MRSALGWACWLIVLSACYAPAGSDCCADKGVSELTEQLSAEQRRIALTYAPAVFQELASGRENAIWDIPTTFDFDGDMIGNNNEESIKAAADVPVAIYYALVETETHYFLTYSLFHALDWSSYTSLVPYSWHENDMENLQVVVQKQSDDHDEAVVLMGCQAHLWTTFVSGPTSDIGGSALSGRSVVLLDEDGYVSATGTHVAVVVQSGGHAIHDFAAEADVFEGDQARISSSIRLMPGGFGQGDIFDRGSEVATLEYALESTHDAFYLPYLQGEHTGQGRLFDGTMSYSDELVSHHGLPRHFDADRLSGPFKSDAGILPFAFSFWLTSRDLGVLFFNPAKKYRDKLLNTESWSNTYVYHPYLGSPLIG